MCVDRQVSGWWCLSSVFMVVIGYDEREGGIKGCGVSALVDRLVFSGACH